jgi:hypothetical protein
LGNTMRVDIRCLHSTHTHTHTTTVISVAHPVDCQWKPSYERWREPCDKVGAGAYALLYELR